MLQKLMEYQEVDKKLKAIEDSLKASEEFKKYAQASKFLRTFNDSKEQYDERAKSLLSAMSELDKSYAALKEEQADFADAGNAEDLSGVSYLKKKSQELSKKFAALENEIQRLTAEINEVVAQYKKLLATAKMMMEQRDEYKVKYEELCKGKDAEKAAINAKLDEIAKDIPKEYMEKYRERRKDNKFPICYEIDIPQKGSVHCSACGTEFSSLQLSNLKQNGFIECENCRKLIFVKK